MAGLGSFITGAVSGYQDGADWKEARKDRKRRRDMEDERFNREKQDWGYQDEQRQWSREDRQYTVSERNREIARRQEEDDFFKGLVDNPTSSDAPAAPPGETTAPADPAPRQIKPAGIGRAAPDTPTMPQEQAGAGRTTDGGTPPMAQTAARVIKPAAPQDTSPPAPGTGFFSQRAEQIGASPQLRNLAAAADVAQIALANPELRPEDRVSADKAVQAATVALEEAARAKAVGGSPETVFPGGLTPTEMAQRQQPQVSPMRQRYPDMQFPPGYLSEDAPKQPVAPTSADAPVQMPAARDRSIRIDPRQSMSRGIMAEPDYMPPSVKAPASEQVARENRQIAAGRLADNRQYSALQPAPLSEPSPSRPVPAQSLPAVTPTTEEGTPQPSLEAATKTTPRTIKSDGTAKPPTAAQAQRQQASFIEDYAKNQVPKIVKFYLGRGERDKADAYQKWADDTLVKEAMKDWAGAVHAASVGDDEGFINGIVGAYNAKGYFDDGYEIVREGSGIQRDEATGAVTGAQVTFKDRNTGKVFTQDFGAGEDLYRLGVDMLSPEQVFEYGWSRVQKKDDMKDAIAATLMKQGLGKAVQADDVLKAMKSMADANLSFQSLPLDEQVMQAIELLRKFGGRIPEGIAVANPADVPVATRPKG